MLEFSGEDCPLITLDVYGTEDAVYLQTGVYNVSDGSPMTVKADPQYTYAKVDGNNVAITAGQMTVEEGMEGAYDITFEFTLEDGQLVAGQWTGLISNYGKMMDITATSAKQVELADPKDGQMRLRFADDNYSFEATVDFFLEPGTTKLAEGNYFWEDEPTAGSIGGGSEIQFYSPKSSQSKAIDGFVSVREGGMTVCLDLTDGRAVNIYFTGEVQYLTPAGEVVNYTYKSVTPEVYANGNVSLYFAGEDYDNSLTLDVYGPTDALYLMPGTYEVNTSTEPWTIDPGIYSYALINGGDTRKLKSGTMTVAFGTEGDYNITTALVMTDGTQLNGTYNGLLPKFGKIMSFKADQAYEVEVTAEGTPENLRRIKFADMAYNFEASVDFFVTPGSKTLPMGLYSFSDTGDPQTIGGDTQVDFYYPSTSSKAIEGDAFMLGTANMIALDLADGRTVNIEYVGDIKYLDRPDPVTEYTDIYASLYGGGNVELKFTGENLPTVKLDVYGAKSDNYLKAGTYQVAPGEVENSIGTEYSEVTVGANNFKLTSGSMTVVENANGTYEISFDVILSDESKLTGKWSGEIPNYARVLNLTAITAKQVENAGVAGQKRIRFNGTDIEATVDFYLAPGTAGIPAGTYNWSDDKAAGSIGALCEINFRSPTYSTHTAVAKGGSATMAEDGTLTVTLEFEDGRTANLTYSGEIIFLEEEPVTGEVVTFTTCEAQNFTYGNFSVKLTGEDTPTVNMDVYTDPAAETLLPGTYNVDGNATIWTIDNRSKYFTYVNKDGVDHSISSGTMVVTGEGTGAQEITLDFVLDDGTTFKGKWNGTIAY